MTKPLPHWDIWQRMPKLSTTQAVALSYGVDPNKISQRDRDTWVYPNGQGIVGSLPGFSDRLMLYKSCHQEPMSPAQFSAWAQSVGWNIPVELASLAPCAPEPEKQPVPDDVVMSALHAIVFPGVSVDDLRAEIENLGCRFVMIDSAPYIHMPDGTVQGQYEPLGHLYQALSSLCRVNPKASKLARMLPAGSSGGGAPGSSYAPRPPARASATAPEAPHSNDTKINIPNPSVKSGPQQSETRPPDPSTIAPAKIPDETEKLEPKQRQRTQEEVILNWLRQHNYDPERLPKYVPGKAGVKSECSKSLRTQRKDLFPLKGTIFNKAWDRLLKSKEIKYAP